MLWSGYGFDPNFIQITNMEVDNKNWTPENIIIDFEEKSKDVLIK